MNWKELTELYNREYELELFPFFYEIVKEISALGEKLVLKAHTSHSSLVVYKQNLDEDEVCIFIQPIIDGRVAFGYIEDRPIDIPPQEAKNICNTSEVIEKIKPYMIEVSKQKKMGA